MPIIKSAKKKLKQDKKRESLNKKYITKYKKALKSLVKKPKNKKNSLKTIYSLIDKAAKKNLIKKQKAARLKSRAAKFVTK
jgi:small subunit ribosomal protein S20